MFLLSILALSITSVYAILIIVYTCHWKKYPAFIDDERNATVKISVIVAYRNEAIKLPFLLNCLVKQNYPNDLFEVILVNDHSEDGSYELISEFCRKNTVFKSLSNNKNQTGKKAALTYGINQAANELIVTTDADCIMGVKWLTAIAACYKRYNPVMIIGLVDLFTGKGFFNQFQLVEFLSLTGSGAATAAGGNPLFCSGANLAYKKELFYEFSDPLKCHVASGDDTLFMLQVKKIHPTKIKLLKSSESIVYTNGALSLPDFIGQRLRWTSKIRYYKDFMIIFTGVLVLLTNLLFLTSLILFIAGINWWLFPALFTGKSIADYVFLRCVARFFSKKIRLIYFGLYDLLYPFYLLIVAGAGYFIPYTWKGRRTKSL